MDGFKSGSKTYTVDSAKQAKDIEMGVLIDGSYIKNPTTQNMSDLIKPGSNYVGNSKMNGQFMYVVDTNGNNAGKSGSGTNTTISLQQALKELDASGLRPGQTELHMSQLNQVLDGIQNNYNPAKAYSSVYSDGIN